MKKKRDKTALVLYYSNKNKYSFNALIGALEADPVYPHIEVIFALSQTELFKSIKGAIDIYKKLIVAISFFTTQLWGIQKLVNKLKKRFKQEILLLGGGPHPTGCPKETLDMGFDIIVVGEGEETLIKLITAIQTDANYKKIKGIAFLERNEYIYTREREVLDLNLYPPFPVKNDKFGPIEITRGCPYLCYFCQTPFILGNSPRHRSIESICKYIRVLKERDLTDIRFITPNAFSYGSPDGITLNLSKAEELLMKVTDLIKPEGRIFFGSFPSEVRPEHVNEDTLHLVKTYAANNNIIIGAQSGSQRILDLCHRGHTVDDVYKAVENTIKMGLDAYVDFIFGLPQEREEDIKLTIEVMKDLTQKGAKIHGHFFIPLPKTPFAKKPIKSINKKLSVEISKLAANGKAFGSWQKQEQLSKKISKYLQKKRSSN